jgi:hypothetical protein
MPCGNRIDLAPMFDVPRGNRSRIRDGARLDSRPGLSY